MSGPNPRPSRPSVSRRLPQRQDGPSFSRPQVTTSWLGMIAAKARVFTAGVSAQSLLGFVVYAAFVAAAAFGVWAKVGWWREMGAAIAWTLLAVRGARRLVDEPRAGSAEAFEIGLLFISSTFLLLSLFGGVFGPLYPLVYALTAYLSAFSSFSASLGFFVALIGAEAALVFGGGPLGQSAKLAFLSHVTFHAFFSVLYSVLLRGEMLVRRKQASSAVAKQLETAFSEARDYRFLAAVNDNSEVDERRRLLASVASVRDAVYNLLAVAERALQPTTLAFYWLDSAGDTLRLKEARGASDSLAADGVPAKEGVFGVILTKCAPLRLSNLRNYRGLAYYREGEAIASDITDFIGVPLLDGPHLRGVLVADRQGGAEFSSMDQAVLEALAVEVMRTVEVERLIGDMDHERKRRERFFRAIQAFARARTTAEVAHAAFESVAQVGKPAFVALLRQEGEDLVIRAQHGLRDDMIGTTVAEPSALSVSALKTATVLPLPGVQVHEHSLFGKQLPTSMVTDARVFPLSAQDRPFGAWVVALSEGRLSPEVDEMLRALSFQVAISCANAVLNDSLERLATTDGLTSLFNRRYFMQLSQERLTRAERYGRKVTLVMVDVDHFKSVNDTYGHPVGDLVLKAVAKVLQHEARKTDVVGRLGGEEFVVLMDETDLFGALQVADRIRERVQREVVASEHGKLSVTISLGVATFPDDGNSLDLLISHADEALYRAKHAGRNRTVAYSTGSSAVPGSAVGHSAAGSVAYGGGK